MKDKVLVDNEFAKITKTTVRKATNEGNGPKNKKLKPSFSDSESQSDSSNFDVESYSLEKERNSLHPNLEYDSPEEAISSESDSSHSSSEGGVSFEGGSSSDYSCCTEDTDVEEIKPKAQRKVVSHAEQTKIDKKLDEQLFVNNLMRRKLVKNAEDGPSMVKIYFNEDQNVNIYASALSTPFKSYHQHEPSEFQIWKISSLQNRNLFSLPSNEAQTMVRLIKSMEVNGLLTKDSKDSSSEPLPSGDYMFTNHTEKLIRLVKVDINELVEKDTVVSFEDYSTSLEASEQPKPFKIVQKDGPINKHEKWFNDLGFKLDYSSVAKMVTKSHRDLYFELTKFYLELIANQCLFKQTENHVTYAEAARELMNRDSDWDEEFIKETIWTIHHYAVNEEEYLFDDEFFTYVHYEKHMALLRMFNRDVVDALKLREPARGSEAEPKLRAAIAKGSKLRKYVRAYNPASYNTLKKPSGKSLQLEFDHINNRYINALEEIEERIEEQMHLATEQQEADLRILQRDDKVKELMAQKNISKELMALGCKFTLE